MPGGCHCQHTLWHLDNLKENSSPRTLFHLFAIPEPYQPSSLPLLVWRPLLEHHLHPPAKFYLTRASCPTLSSLYCHTPNPPLSSSAHLSPRCTNQDRSSSWTFPSPSHTHSLLNSCWFYFRNLPGICPISASPHGLLQEPLLESSWSLQSNSPHCAKGVFPKQKHPNTAPVCLKHSRKEATHCSQKELPPPFLPPSSPSLSGSLRHRAPCCFWDQCVVFPSSPPFTSSPC